MTLSLDEDDAECKRKSKRERDRGREHTGKIWVELYSQANVSEPLILCIKNKVSVYTCGRPDTGCRHFAFTQHSPTKGCVPISGEKN